jgi:excisionase family DNA binding protein
VTEASLTASRRRLTDLIGRCEALLGQTDERAVLLAEMREFGGRIDVAYAKFESSPLAEADRLRLGRTQSEIQTKSEALRRQADAVLTEWWDLHREVGEALVEAARHAPTVLSVARSFKRLATPNDADLKLQLMQLRAHLDKALRLCAPPEPRSAPAKPKRTRDAESLMTAGEVAEFCGVSDKTVYRWADQGHIPYTRIQSILRFRRRDVLRWLKSKSFQPKSIRRADPGR